MVAWNSVSLPTMSPEASKQLLREVQLLHNLKHKNVLELRGAFVKDGKNDIVFLTEILEGSLKQYIGRAGIPIRWVVVKKWMTDILRGLEFLHSQEPPIIHRDIKADNLLLDKSRGHVCIGDLGLARPKQEGDKQNMTFAGTPSFMAPEMLEGGTYDTKVDIYATGMVLIEILTQRYPYDNLPSAAHVYKAVCEGKEPSEMEHIINEDARGFINTCRTMKPEDRPTATILLESNPFITTKGASYDQEEVPMSEYLRKREVAVSAETVAKEPPIPTFEPPPPPPPPPPAAAQSAGNSGEVAEG